MYSRSVALRAGLVALAAPALFAFASFGSFAACAEGQPSAAGGDAALPPAPFEPPKDFNRDAAADADASFKTCASAAVEAKREQLPVDIIWVVDNSSSMQTAVSEVQAGLNAFATVVGSKGIDYKVVMLSLRGDTPVDLGGKTLYPVCVPPPLGGDACGNTALFFHAPLNVLSTQPLEQLLGTLDQTTGYTAGNQRGSEPWSQELRPKATKSIVVVTDDNSRFPGVSFEMFPGGDNPNTGGLVLPVGILHPARPGGPWKGYSFSALYGWGTSLDPSIRCSYPDGSKPTASGSEYTALVQKTGGARAQICDGSAAWAPFFDAVATAVIATARVACEVPIPAPDAGTVDPSLVNVRVTDGTKPALTVPRVNDESGCAGLDGWYYDVPKTPTKVFLCPKSCEGAQSNGGSKIPKVEVLFGCATVVR